MANRESMLVMISKETARQHPLRYRWLPGHIQSFSILRIRMTSSRHSFLLLQQLEHISMATITHEIIHTRVPPPRSHASAFEKGLFRKRTHIAPSPTTLSSLCFWNDRLQTLHVWSSSLQSYTTPMIRICFPSLHVRFKSRWIVDVRNE